MNAAEIAAYVGAGAWLPQIATWVYRSVVRPVATLVPEEASPDRVYLEWTNSQFAAGPRVKQS